MVITDGPFAETREQLGGYYLVEAKNLDEALALAARIPTARHGASRFARSGYLGTVSSPAGCGRGAMSNEARGSRRGVFSREAGRVLATLIRLLGDFDLAEEVRQEAFVAALERWPVRGIPENPSAWLIRMGRNKGIDRIRRQPCTAMRCSAKRRASSAKRGSRMSPKAIWSSVTIV